MAGQYDTMIAHRSGTPMSDTKQNLTPSRWKLLVFYGIVVLLGWLALDRIDRPRFRNQLNTALVRQTREYNDDLQAEIDSIWSRIENGLARNDKKLLKRLKPPATETEIAAVEAKLGYPLPGELKASLKVHNGAIQLVSNHELYTAAGIPSLQDVYVDSCITYPIGRLHPDPAEFHPFWHPGWLPVGGWEVYELIVNTETGGVYEWNEHSMAFQATSWKRWLENVARRLESGRFKLIDGDWTNESRYHSPGAEEETGWE